jgi:hypothetical protein
LGIAAGGIEIPIDGIISSEVPSMFDPRDVCDRPRVYARAEPDDEYDRKPEPLDPYLYDRDDDDIEDIQDQDELDEDEL